MGSDGSQDEPTSKIAELRTRVSTVRTDCCRHVQRRVVNLRGALQIEATLGAKTLF
jgi:hypothetical protein